MKGKTYKKKKTFMNQQSLASILVTDLAMGKKVETHRTS